VGGRSQAKENTMTERASFVDETRERAQSAFHSVEDEINKFQKRIESRTSELNKRAEKRFKQLRSELRKYEVVQRAESFADDVSRQLESRGKRIEKQLETGLETVLGTFQIASRGEIEKLDRKLDRINRRLKALDKSLSRNAAPTQSRPKTAVAE
jgi:polyhydroxyalkanoate synthesis regulator phasin